MRIALVVLLVAFVAVLVRDRDFWFGADETANDSTVSQNVAPVASAAQPARIAAAPVAQNLPAANTSSQGTALGYTAPQTRDVAKSNASAVPAKRPVVSSLKVEILPAEQHRVPHSAAKFTKVALPNDANRAVTSAKSRNLQPTNAAEREVIASEAAPQMRQTLDATYPLLGPRMKVQGAVVLEAVIGTDGNIENLRVISGPAILSVAAQQAVRQWHFKPYVHNGEPVETSATITVNFSIQVADNPAQQS